MVGVSTICDTKSAVSWLLSEIQCLSRACSMSNEPQNMVFFSFSNYCIAHEPVRRVGSVTQCHYFYYRPPPFINFSEDQMKNSTSLKMETVLLTRLFRDTGLI